MSDLYGKLSKYKSLLAGLQLGIISEEEFSKTTFAMMEEDYDFFKIMSERAIELGVVERLSPEGYLKTVMLVAHKIASLAVGLELAQAPRPENHKEYYNIEGLDNTLKTMDQIISTMSLAAGVPASKVDIDIQAATSVYVKQMMNAIIKTQ